MPTLPEICCLAATPTRVTRAFLWVTQQYLIVCCLWRDRTWWNHGVSLMKPCQHASAETGGAHWTVPVHSHVCFLLVTPTRRQWQLVAIREEKCHCRLDSGDVVQSLGVPQTAGWPWVSHLGLRLMISLWQFNKLLCLSWTAVTVLVCTLTQGKHRLMWSKV